MFYQLLCFFIIYAFLGWCLEVAFCSIDTGKFVNRGFLNGPVCPIYGFGATLVVMLLQPFENNFVLLFIGSVVVTSLLELVGGFLLDKIFHTKWWDYSDAPFNIGGYICLKFSLAWGVCCLFLVKFIHPAILFLVEITPFWLGIVLLCFLYTLLICDLVVTVFAILKMNRNLGEIADVAAALKAGSNVMAKNIGNTAISAADKINALELEEKKNKLLTSLEEQKDKLLAPKEEGSEEPVKDKIVNAYNDAVKSFFEKNTRIRKRLLRAFPDMKSKRNPNELDSLRSFFFGAKQEEGKKKNSKNTAEKDSSVSKK